jgi:hypothetical protein
VSQTIDRSTLIKVAQDTAQRRMQERPSLISAYLTGSVAANEPLLGEATDIDLILIDEGVPPPREVSRLTDHIVLDIQYRGTAEYVNPKALRVHPWRGPEMAEPLFLLDPKHFFELAQSSARGQFHRPDNVAARARAFARMARDELHLSLLPGQEPTAPVTLANLCQVLLYAANAVITLTGLPGAGRRLLMKLESAARKLRRPDLYDDFMDIFGGPNLDAAQAQIVLTDWSAVYRTAQTPGTDQELLHPVRRMVYERGFQAQIAADRSAEMLWLMLYTWQACVKRLPGDSPHAEPWANFLERLRLASRADFSARVKEAQAYLALADEVVETWADRNGA